MKHFTTVEWIDLVNQVVTPSVKQQMEEHLANCKQCTTEFLRWQRIRQLGAGEESYQPPEETVRIVKAAFAGSQFAAQRRGARGALAVLFDSFLQPALAGVRSAGSASRRMLYGADPYQIDLQIEAQNDGKSLLVTGQLMDFRQPEMVGSEVPVLFSNLRGGMIQGRTNQFGEFRAEMENSGDLELVFDRGKDEPIVISLRDALGRFRA
jgi:hypothetical protein